jgi:hypothetical protein
MTNEMVFRLRGVSLTPSAWLVSEHPKELMLYSQNCLSSYLKGTTVIDTEEYRDMVCGVIGSSLSKAFGHQYSVSMINSETNDIASSITESITLRVHADTYLSVTPQ